MIVDNPDQCGILSTMAIDPVQLCDLIDCVLRDGVSDAGDTDKTISSGSGETFITVKRGRQEVRWTIGEILEVRDSEKAFRKLILDRWSLSGRLRCYQCSGVKSISEFYRHSGRPRGYREECKDCSKALIQKWRKKNRRAILARRRLVYKQGGETERAKVRENSYKNKHGISRDEAKRLIWDQKNRCALCGEPMEPLGIGKYAAVYDHCHTTNKHRAMIHSNCNCLLGFAQDSVALLHKAVQYLETHHAA